MSTTLSVKAFSCKENKEFLKHYNAVKFCIENELSYPKETSDFFKGKICGNDLEDIKNEYILQYIENGLEIDMEYNKINPYEIHIKVSEIPTDAEILIIKLQ